jgi:hypothetical protein
MVLAASLSNEMTITEHHLIQAEFLVSELEDNMGNVFRHIADNRDSMLSLQMYDMIRNAHSYSKKELWRRMLYRCSFEEFERGIKGLIIADLIYETTAGTSIVYRLPTQDKAPSSNEKGEGTIARWEALALEASHHETAVSNSEEVVPNLYSAPDQE